MTNNYLDAIGSLTNDHQVSSRLPSNPFYAFVEFTIGDGLNLTPIPPDHLISFDYKRITNNSMNTFTLTVFDESAIILESKLIEAAGRMVDSSKFRYGYSNGISSPVYTARVTNYQIDLQPSGAVLTVEGVSTSSTAFDKPITKAYNDMRIDQIVTAIAEEEGWTIGEIVETQQVRGEDGSPNRKFIRTNQPAQVFITNTLIPLAKSATTGESNYILYFDDSTSPVTVNFYPCTDPAMKMAGYNDKLKNYTFTYGSGDRDTRVISFQPELLTGINLARGAGNIEASTVDKIKNELFIFNQNKDTDPTRFSMDPKLDYTPDISNIVIGGSSYTREEMQNIAAHAWYDRAAYPIKATLDILGDPLMNPRDVISVVAMNKFGIPHHSSGVYLITEIDDSIQGGSFTTQLSLFRNAMKIGFNESGGLTIDLIGNATVPTQGSSSTDYKTYPAGTGSIDWPTSSTTVSSPYGWRWGRMHNGIDIPGNNMSIKAADSGIVIVADNETVYNGGLGYYVVIKHTDSLYTMYAHMSEFSVTTGQAVHKGDEIGKSGYTGHCVPSGPDGAHLHFGVANGPITSGGTSTNWIDPISMLVGGNG